MADLNIGNLVGEILLAIVVGVLVPTAMEYFKAKRDEAKANAENAGMDKRRQLVERVKLFLYGTAANIAEKKIPDIAANVVAGKLKSVVEVKTCLRALGEQLREDAKAHFGQQGIDLAKEVTDAALDNWIERAANQVSPFPGLETAKVLAKKQVADLLVRRGTVWMKSNAQRVIEALDKQAKVAEGPIAQHLVR
jgi:hypothetical protein